MNDTTPPARLLARNTDWAAAQTARDGDFFARHCGGQKPSLLWIGCSDSRVPAERLVGADLGDMFVHRNIANVAAPDDASCQAVLQYAIGVLRVPHVALCGHYGCGGVKAALDGTPLDGLDALNGWLRNIKTVIAARQSELQQAPPERRADLLCEWNVLAQVQNIAASSAAQNAWRAGQPLTLHGWIYSMQTGKLKALNSINAPSAGV